MIPIGLYVVAIEGGATATAIGPSRKTERFFQVGATGDLEPVPGGSITALRLIASFDQDLLDALMTAVDRDSLSKADKGASGVLVVDQVPCRGYDPQRPVTMDAGTPALDITPAGARAAAHLIRKRAKGDEHHPRRPETSAAMLAAADWLDQFVTTESGGAA